MSSGKSPKEQWQRATKPFKDKKKDGKGFWEKVSGFFDLGDQGDFSAMGKEDSRKVTKAQAKKIKD